MEDERGDTDFDPKPFYNSGKNVSAIAAGIRLQADFRSSLEIHVGGICVATGGASDHSYLARFFSFKGIRLLPVAALRTTFRTRL